MNSATNSVSSPGEKPSLPKPAAKADPTPEEREFIRAENEDDDGYDPYSDRRSKTKPPGRNQMRPGDVLFILRQTRSTSRLPTCWT